MAAVALSLQSVDSVQPDILHVELVQPNAQHVVFLDVYEIGEDYILGHATDDFDIEYVQMFRLTRFSS